MAQKKYDNETIKKTLELAKNTSPAKAAKQAGIPYSSFMYYYKKAQQKETQKTEKIIKPLQAEEEVKSNPYISYQPAEKTTYKRGDIYYVHKMTTTGSEMATGRPAIIVSNDRLNDKLDAVEVVFITTKSKCLAPEHLVIKSSGTMATVICEQITTIDKHRLGNFYGHCSPDEIEMLDKALLASIGLEKYTDVKEIDNQIVSRVAAIKAERDAYKQIYDDLFNRMMKMKQ